MGGYGFEEASVSELTDLNDQIRVCQQIFRVKSKRFFMLRDGVLDSPRVLEGDPALNKRRSPAVERVHFVAQRIRIRRNKGLAGGVQPKVLFRLRSVAELPVSLCKPVVCGAQPAPRRRGPKFVRCSLWPQRRCGR